MGELLPVSPWGGVCILSELDGNECVIHACGLGMYPSYRSWGADVSFYWYSSQREQWGVYYRGGRVISYPVLTRVWRK